MNVEKRRYSRISIKLRVEYRGEKVWQNVNVENISKGGMFIVTDKIEPPGTKIELLFDFGKEIKRKIMAEAVVVWNRKTQEQQGDEGKKLPQGMGIEFTKMFPEDAEKFLNDFIEKWNK